MKKTDGCSNALETYQRVEAHVVYISLYRRLVFPFSVLFFSNSLSVGFSESWSEVLISCRKWHSPPKTFFGVFSKQFFTWSHSPLLFFGQLGVASKKFVEGSANFVLRLCSTWLLLHPSFFGRFRQRCFTFIYQASPVKFAWIVDMSRPYNSPQKMTDLLLGYSLGFLNHGRFPLLESPAGWAVFLN